jgi:hypothetical protein
MWTPEKQREYNAAYYQSHRAEEIERVRSRQAATLAFLRDLRRRPCADCGQTYPPWGMDFDHRDPSTKSFALAADKVLLKPRSVLLEEIAKCDVVCANCHALRTYAQIQERKARLGPDKWTPGKSARIEYRRARWRANAKFLNEIRRVPCADCGVRYEPWVMQFDHRDGTKKKFLVSRMIHRGRKTILEEVAKCDIVCANCHRERTYQRRMAARGSSSAR